MIQVIFGEKGTGKTKRMLELANRLAKEAKGSSIFIDDDNSYMYDLDYCIRFINAKDYAIAGPKMFYGFLCGLAASDYDLEYIFVDGFATLIRHDLGTLGELFDQLRTFTEEHKLNLILSVSGTTSELPAFMRDLVM